MTAAYFTHAQCMNPPNLPTSLCAPEYLYLVSTTCLYPIHQFILMTKATAPFLKQGILRVSQVLSWPQPRPLSDPRYCVGDVTSD